jgi:quercetin dioxygenase-like cupin family protein
MEPLRGPLVQCFQRPKQPTGRGPEAPSKLSIAAGHFSPGARTAWHSHEGGETLYVTEGRGLVQSRGEQTVEIRPGDVVYTPDREEHWHGASAKHFLSHLSITEGSPTWGAQVTADEYRDSQSG